MNPVCSIAVWAIARPENAGDLLPAAIVKFNQRVCQISRGKMRAIAGMADRRVPRKHTAARERSGVIRCDRQPREAHGVILFRGAETHTRSVLKAISWRTLGTLDTFAISWFMTGRIEVAGSIAGLEIITKIAWYYLHERLWASITWGRR